MSAARCVGAMSARPVALAGASRAGRARVAGVAPARGLGGPGLPARRARRALAARADAAPDDSSASSATSAPKDETRISVDDVMMDSTALPANFCIIEGGARDKVRDFADMGVDELLNNIESRKNKVFIMLEEVRRLRVQVQLKNKTEEVRKNTFGFEPATRARDGDVVARLEPSRSPVPAPADVSRIKTSAHPLSRASSLPPSHQELLPPVREYPSVVPGFPRITENTFNDYYIYWGACVAAMLIFGGLIAPLAEVKLGLGGTSYLDFIESVHLPRQLAMVDPIVASFTGGAVGAISAFFVIEIQNFKEQEKKLCMYCKGSGYLTCAECCTSPRPGRLIDPVSGAKSFCGTCSGTAKVMCTSCLCTGMAMVTEHDPRIDPFD